MNVVIGHELGGRYQIISDLGGGGFGKTFVAEDKHLPGNHRCVVKQLKSQASDPSTLQTARRLFETEAQVLYRLGNHDQIPQLFAYFEENEEFYLVQELIEGHNLSEELVLGEPWIEEQVIKLLQEILEILEFVHQQNVIHRDVNPHNLIRRKKDNKLVLIDFGAVKEITTTGITRNLPRFTISIGTPGYQSSEQANGHPRLSSDIYAVGMIGIQALTGLFPNQLLTDSATGEISWREQASVSLEFANILDKMVRYDFRDRYSSATEALQAFRDLSQPASATLVVSPAFTKLPKYRSILSKLLVVGGCISIATLGVVSLSHVINASNATEFYKQGKTLADLKRYEEALTVYQKAIELKPDYAEAWIERGKILYQLKQYKPSLEATDKAIQLNPELSAAWIGRGNTLNDLQRYDEGLVSFDKALQIQLNQAEAWNGRGNSLTYLKRYQDAIAAYDKAVEFQPDFQKAWYSRGRALHNLQRYEEAIASYNKAVELKPDDSQSWYHQGNSLSALKRYQDAILAYDKAVQFQPDYYQAWYSRGNVLLNLQKYEEVVESFNKVTRLQPTDSQAWYNKGWALHQLRRYEQAVTAYDQALQLKRNNYQVWYNRGNSLYNLQRYIDAIASYNRATRYKPDHYESWYSRGNALFNLKRYQDAIAAYDKAIRYKPDYQQAIAARSRAQVQLDLQKFNLNQKKEDIKPPQS